MYHNSFIFPKATTEKKKVEIGDVVALISNLTFFTNPTRYNEIKHYISNVGMVVKIDELKIKVRWFSWYGKKVDSMVLLTSPYFVTLKQLDDFLKHYIQKKERNTNEC